MPARVALDDIGAAFVRELDGQACCVSEAVFQIDGLKQPKPPLEVSHE